MTVEKLIEILQKFNVSQCEACLFSIDEDENIDIERISVDHDTDGVPYRVVIR